MNEYERSAKRVLHAWNLHAHLPTLTASADGWAIIAHLCNAGAKRIDSRLYDEKPLLVERVVELHPFVWARDEIVYVETAVGQVSFHVFDGEDEFAPERSEDTHPWAGGWMQDGAYAMALALLGVLDVKEEFQFERWLGENQPRERE